MLTSVVLAIGFLVLLLESQWYQTCAFNARCVLFRSCSCISAVSVFPCGCILDAGRLFITRKYSSRHQGCTRPTCTSTCTCTLATVHPACWDSSLLASLEPFTRSLRNWKVVEKRLTHWPKGKVLSRPLYTFLLFYRIKYQCTIIATHWLSNPLTDPCLVDLIDVTLVVSDANCLLMLQ